MRAPLRVALIPMTSTDKVEVNVQNILASLQKIKTSLDIVFLPENSLYFNFNKTLNPDHALQSAEPLVELEQWSRKTNTFIHFGGVAFKTKRGICNTSLLLDPTNGLQPLYDKVHLFDVDVAGRRVRESDSFVAGDGPAVLNIRDWKIGLSICYDLRFAEMFIHYHKQKVDAIVVPSSFLVETGRAHWNVLLRARAIETQSYIIAPAQVGTHRSVLQPELGVKTTWGESLVVGPWGNVLARTADFDAGSCELLPLIFDLQPEALDTVRSQMPVLSHRKLSL